MKRFIIILVIIAAVASCKKGPDDAKDTKSSEIILISSFSGFSDALLNRSSVTSDPFELKDIVITDDSVKITVAYSGGCKKHSFEIIWNETISSTVPPQTGIIIIHNANQDMCEAYITETLAFCISDLTSAVSLDTLCVSILNGCTPADSISSGGWDPSDSTDYDTGDIKITFPEGDICKENVTD